MMFGTALISSSYVVIYIMLFTLHICDETKSEQDILTPYAKLHGSYLTHRSIQECQPVEYSNVPHEHYPAHKSTDFQSQVLKVKYFSHQTTKVRGHLSVVSDPARTMSILEPQTKGGCARHTRETVAVTAIQKQCLVATNAGYFNTHSGACLGNIVSDNKKIQDSGGIQNVHFGIKNNGSLFFGYVSENEVEKGAGDFKQLVGGVVWLVRNGTVFVDPSKSLECESTEETGHMDYFVNVQSARTAVGHDKEGRLILVQVDGKTNIEGFSLWELAEFMKSIGAINAINLDGGGSSTFVINGTVINYPSDDCEDTEFKCARKVSTVLCVHSPECLPPDCSNHGKCSANGVCTCDPEWEGRACDTPSCRSHNCSENGRCTENGCLCDSGWTGKNCSIGCPMQTYGNNCSKTCDCIRVNSLSCDPVSGFCLCKPGFAGRYCHLPCPFGFFGINCTERCACNNTCGCESVTGFCHSMEDYVSTETQCYVDQLILKGKLVNLDPSNCRSWMQAFVFITLVAGISVIGLFAWYCCASSKVNYSHFKTKWQRIPSSYDENLDGISEEEIPMSSVANSVSISPSNGIQQAETQRT